VRWKRPYVSLASYCLKDRQPLVHKLLSSCPPGQMGIEQKQKSGRKCFNRWKIITQRTLCLRIAGIFKPCDSGILLTQTTTFLMYIFDGYARLGIGNKASWHCCIAANKIFWFRLYQGGKLHVLLVWRKIEACQSVLQFHTNWSTTTAPLSLSQNELSMSNKTNLFYRT